MAQLEDIKWALDEFSDDDIEKMERYHDYLEGDHPVPFDLASTSYAKAFRSMLCGIRENLCPAVISAPAERLAITGWEGTGESAYLAMGGNRLANRVHREALTAGRSFVLLWPSGPGMKAHMHKGDSMCVRVSDEDPDKITLAAKMWASDGGWRLNLYYSDRCMRFYCSAKAPKADKFAEFTDDESGAEVRHQFGAVPVIPFVNGGETGEEGKSELRDVVPLQDALNKTLADVIIGSEFSALPKRIFTGVSDDKDPMTGESEMGNASKKASGGGLREMYLSNPDAKAFNLPGADLDKLISVTDAFEMKVAKVTGTPLHYFLLGSGQFPSGEALRTAETRLISRVVDMQQDFTPSWSRLMELWGTTSAPEWADAAALTASEQYAVLKLKQDLGVSQQEIWREMGYDETDIARMEADKPTLDTFSAAMSGAV